MADRERREVEMNGQCIPELMVSANKQKKREQNTCHTHLIHSVTLSGPCGAIQDAQYINLRVQDKHNRESF